MKTNSLLSTEFLFGVLVVVCATVLLGLDKIDAEAWKWAVTTVGGAYVLGRSLVKATDSTGQAKVAEFKADLNALVAATPPGPVTVVNNALPAEPTNEDLAALLAQTRTDLDSLKADLSKET